MDFTLYKFSFAEFYPLEFYPPGISPGISLQEFYHLGILPSRNFYLQGILPSRNFYP